VTPLRKVTKEVLRGGASVFANFHYHWWELTLECGHVAERRCRYRPDGVRRRGYAAQHHAPSLNRLMDAPKRVRCDECQPPDTPRARIGVLR
jgi:hypothetical protein